MSGEEALTWVLLRGLTREARHWGEMKLQLRHQLDLAFPAARRQVVALDLPGNGALFAEASPASVRGMVEAARRQLTAAGLKPPYALLALSLGGMVATDWAQRYPGEVERLVLINTSMRPYSGIAQRLRPASWLRLLWLAACWHKPDAAERIIHHLTCSADSSRNDDLPGWVAIRKSAPVSAASALRQVLAAARFRCAATPPRCPALVLSSTADRLVDARCSAALAAAWLAPHYRHPWAGHDLPHDDAAWVAQRITGWLHKEKAGES